MVSEKNPTLKFYQMRRYVNCQPWIYTIVKKGDTFMHPGSRDSLLVTASDSWSKGCKFESRQKRRDNSLLQSWLCVLTLIRCPFHSHVTTMTRKHPRLSAKSADGRLNLNTHTSLTQRSRSGLCCCPGRVWESIRKRAHTQLFRVDTRSVVSARRATVDWSWPKERN